MMRLKDYLGPGLQGTPTAEISNSLETFYINRLIYTARNGAYSARVSAIKALGKTGKPCGVDTLIQALDDKDVMVRYYAVIALGEIGDKRALKPLISVLENGDGGISWRAAEALGRFGDAGAVAPLIKALGNKTPMVAFGAANALVEIGAEHVLEPLVETLSSNNNSTARKYAAFALGWLGDRQALPALVEAYQKETAPTAESKEVREALIKAFESLT